MTRATFVFRLKIHCLYMQHVEQVWAEKWASCCRGVYGGTHVSVRPKAKSSMSSSSSLGSGRLSKTSPVTTTWHVEQAQTPSQAPANPRTKNTTNTSDVGQQRAASKHETIMPLQSLVRATTWTWMVHARLNNYELG